MLLQVVGYVAIGFPLGFWANILLHGRSHWQQVKQLHVPKLFITGDRDNFTTMETLQEYLDGLSASSRSNGSPGAAAEVELKVVQGADHFYVDRWQELAEIVLSWVARIEGRQH